ncbi:MAG: MBL fold metallo-hydrolase [Erysipelotrichaceae bacterium]|nr:MBL fold metallo-hydrolase [Erysipelotrichaceae bacterium]
MNFDSIDLGNLFWKIIHIPGHTAGSIGILIPKLKLFLSGDTLSPSICLNFPNALTIDDLINTLYSIQKLNFNSYLTSHHNHLVQKEYINDLIKCCLISKKEKNYKYISPLEPNQTRKLYIYSNKYGECISIIY